MKRILFSLGTILAVGAAVAGGTAAFYADTETSAGNIFVAGSIDLTVDHALATYNGQPCTNSCLETGSDLIVNGGFELPIVTDNGGGWQIYPVGIPGWLVESGDGIELQRNSVAGDPNGGVQLVELDSTSPSSMAQTLATVPGSKYRLHFFHSPRPGVGAGENTIGLAVIAGDSSVIISDTIGLAAIGGGNTVWTEYVYDFTAVDALTKIVFTDLGTISNFLGGYIDDVSLFVLNCSGGFVSGGTCSLWPEKNLEPGDQFYNFTDVKPGDYGANVISLHVESNNAYACLIAHDIVDQDNSVVDPELALNDDAITGELSPLIKVFAWDDSNQDGIHQLGENQLLAPNTPISTEIVALSLTGGGPTAYLGVAWCAGNQSLDVNGAVVCDGSGNQNIAQTDSFTASITAYAEQQRNNPNFSCANVAASLNALN